MDMCPNSAFAEVPNTCWIAVSSDSRIGICSEEPSGVFPLLLPSTLYGVSDVIGTICPEVASEVLHPLLPSTLDGVSDILGVICPEMASEILHPLLPSTLDGVSNVIGICPEVAFEVQPSMFPSKLM